MTRILTVEEMGQSVAQLAETLHVGDVVKLMPDGKTLAIVSAASPDVPKQPFDIEEWLHGAREFRRSIKNPPTMEEIKESIEEGRE